MAKRKGGGGKADAKPNRSEGRKISKAYKQRPKVFDPIKRRLVTKTD